MFDKSKLMMLILSMAAATAASAQVASTPMDLSAAPTIDALSKIARVELDMELQKRNAKILGGTEPVAKAAPIANPTFVAPRPPAPAMVQNMEKRVLAIYGRAGMEVAEIRLPGGQVVVAQSGAHMDGFHIVRVEKSSVVVDVPVPRKKGARRLKNKAPETRQVTVAVGSVFQ